MSFELAISNSGDQVERSGNRLDYQLPRAERHDVLRKPAPDWWGFCVPLMRRWLRIRQ
jgi:hypothetical protein